MPTRADLRQLPLADLTARCDAALRAASERHNLPPVRALGLPRAVMIEIVHTAGLRATMAHGHADERATG